MFLLHSSEYHGTQSGVVGVHHMEVYTLCSVLMLYTTEYFIYKFSIYNVRCTAPLHDIIPL